MLKGKLSEQLRVEQKRLKEEAGQLEQYLEEYDSSPAVLEHLAQVQCAGRACPLAVHRGAAGLPGEGSRYLPVPGSSRARRLDTSLCCIAPIPGWNPEEKAGEQAGVVRELLEKKQAQDTLVNLDRFYYAVLLDECDGNRREALNQLAVILDTEPEESTLYIQAESYREQLESRDPVLHVKVLHGN